jgi:DNA-binding MarR family transcriptional regulator
MTRVKAPVLPRVPEHVDLHVAVLAGRLMAEIREVFAREDWDGLRQSHFRLLSLVPPDGISVTELAERLGMTKQAAGQFVTQLEGTGHLESQADPADRRLRVVTRTALGDRTNKAVSARIRRIERAWARRVGEDRYAQFREVLTEIALGPDRRQ